MRRASRFESKWSNHHLNRPSQFSVQPFRHPFYDVAFSTLDKAHDGFTILSGETKVT